MGLAVVVVTFWVALVFPSSGFCVMGEVGVSSGTRISPSEETALFSPVGTGPVSPVEAVRSLPTGDFWPPQLVSPPTASRPHSRAATIRLLMHTLPFAAARTHPLRVSRFRWFPGYCTRSRTECRWPAARRRPEGFSDKTPAYTGLPCQAGGSLPSPCG